MPLSADRDLTMGGEKAKSLPGVPIQSALSQMAL